MSYRDRPRFVWALPLIALALALVGLGSDWAGLATGLRGALFDAYQRAHPRAYVDTRGEGFSVRVLQLSDTSHAGLARTLSALRAQGAELAVLLSPLDEADPVSPRDLVAELPPGPDFDAMRTALQAMPSPDTALTKAFGEIATVTSFALGDAGNGFAPKRTLSYAGDKNPFGRTPEFAGAEGPVAALAQGTAGSGARNLPVASDGRLRRVPLAFRLNGREVASLDAEVLRVAGNKRTLSLRAGDGGDLIGGAAGAASVTAFHRELPTAPDGSLWLAFARDAQARHLKPDALGDLKHSIVYLGRPGARLMTPLGPMSELDVHAEAMENVLLGTVLRRPAAATRAELACLLLVGLAIVLLLVRFNVWWAGAFTAAAIASAGAISWQLFASNKVLFDALGPGAGLAFVFAAGAAARMIEVAGAHAKLQDAFADSLAAPLIERIARKPQLLKLDGEARNVTYLVCGVRGFTQLSATFKDDPFAFMRLLQRVFAPLMDTALAHRGTIERLSAEGFSCFWNAPLDDPEHAIHACEAAAAMMEVIARINDVIVHERRIDGTALAPVEIGIGLSTGPAIVGGFRNHGRTTYSAVGECAVTAARIQSLSATYGPAIIVSEDTRKAAERGFAFLETDYVELGAQPVKLYALLGNPVMRASPKFRALSTFHDHIFQSMRTQQWEKTRELIEQCRKLSGASQKLYDLHLSRIAWYEDHPPGADWDGAFRPVLK